MSAPGEPQEFFHRGFHFKYIQDAKISNSSQLEALSAVLETGNIPLPEMTYGSHYLEVLRDDGGMKLRFDARGALLSWHALQKTNSLVVDGELLPVDVTNYDYTYTSAYDGEFCLTEGGCEFSSAAPSRTVPLELLKARGPILAFASVPLFASDLNDRGVVEVGVKLRVMDDFFLVLCRSFTRLDRDMVRLRDVRYFHKFGDRDVLRDVQLRVGRAEDVARVLGLGEGGVGGSTLPKGLPSFFLPSSPANPARGNSPGCAVTSPLPPPTSPPVSSNYSRSPVHPVVLASMRERAAKRGLRVLDDGTIVGSDDRVCTMSPEGESHGGSESGARGETQSPSALYATHFATPGKTGGGPLMYSPPPLRPLATSPWGSQDAEPWPARPGASPPPMSPQLLVWEGGPLSQALAITADDVFEALQPVHHMIQALDMRN